MADIAPIAIVTGGTRGMGFETCRQLARLGYKVILTGRDLKQADQAAETLDADGYVDAMQLDVSDPESIAAFCDAFVSSFRRADVLINNAGILLGAPRPEDVDAASIFRAPLAQVEQSMRTNVYGPLELCQRLAPLMRDAGSGRIVNISSGMGQLSDMNGGWIGYRMSKAALNVITRVLADELSGTGVTVNSVCPGWVQTDMGGTNATRTVEHGVETTIWLATSDEAATETGGFFRDKQRIAW